MRKNLATFVMACAAAYSLPLDQTPVARAGMIFPVVDAFIRDGDPFGTKEAERSP